VQRIGLGLDTHRLEIGRQLILGGAVVPSPHGPVAHSDGDALAHATADAVLGAIARGDIGQYFPDTDPANQGLAGSVIVKRAVDLARQAGYRVVNISAVITLDQPKLAPHRLQICASLAAMLGVDVAQVGLSLKTSEGQATGLIAVQVVALLEKSS